MKSIDPAGVEQVRIEVVGRGAHHPRRGRCQNLELLGGGAPMVYVRAYVDTCIGARAFLELFPAAERVRGSESRTENIR